MRRCDSSRRNGATGGADVVSPPISNDGERPHFLPSDFSPQTWLDVLQRADPSTRRYCGAGAAVLTAVIVIHPLALMGVAATAAVSATAVWAVGFFHELDRGYQIWTEEFGMLFWEDNNDKDEGPAIAATVTSESHQIIRKDEEHLRQAFVLEQERRSLMEARVKVVRVNVEVAGEVAHGEAPRGNEYFEEDREEERDDAGPLSKSVNEKGMLRRQRGQEPRKQYLFRRIKSDPIKAASSLELSKEDSIDDKDNNQPSSTPETLPGTPPIKPKVAPKHPHQPPNKSTSSLKRQIIPAPTAADITPTRTTSSAESSLTTSKDIESHFPPLEIRVIHGVDLPGLNTAEFFRVFFADNAPYSMRDFQKKRGDVDIIYGKWSGVSGGEAVDKQGGGRGDTCPLYSFKENDGKSDPIPLPPNSTQERTLQFNTLTKSYFGPAYAKATKTQRATQLSSYILVIEHVTQLADIPFADRFRVIERWVVESVRNDRTHTDQNSTSQQGQNYSNSGDAMRSTSCRLSIHAEVQMLKPCPWESQIRKKASETFTSVATEWCKSATVALGAAEEQKRKRLRRNPLGGAGSSITARESTSINRNVETRQDRPTSLDATTRPPKEDAPHLLSMPTTPPRTLAPESHLFARHQQNFQELDKLVARGDFDLEEWCSVEVMHSLRAGRQSAFAQVLEEHQPSPSSSPGVTEYFSKIGSSVTKSTEEEFGEMEGSTVRAPATVTMRRKSRKLFKKLSSRVIKSRQPR